MVIGIFCAIQSQRAVEIAEEGEIGCVVPVHQDLKVDTLSGILKQAQVTVEEFIENL
ncbi:MAG: type II toxin-antitoxin system HicA family toxin [Microcoleus sp.]